MNELPTSGEHTRAWVSAWITAMLSVAAAVGIGFGVWLALGEGDTEPLESPLMLSVARQLDHGPWGLYGPFGSQNPLVLIHAPLYYHLAAIVARPLSSAGLDSITAARLTGRGISFLGLLLTAWGAYRIARFDGAPARAGWWAACLIVSAPVMGRSPFTVRPDMLGVASRPPASCSSLKALFSARPGGMSSWGLCRVRPGDVRQAAPRGRVHRRDVSSALGRAARSVAPRLIGLGVLTAAAIVATVYGVEEVATQGQMSQALFVASAGSSGCIRPTGSVR